MRQHTVLLILVVTILVWSAIRPHDIFTWFLEVVPVLIAVPILGLTYRRFPLTNLAYVLIAIHALILMVGGHYTYAEVPAFNWLRDTLNLSRNHYDRVGHFAQGFIPAIVTREIFIRHAVVTNRGWLSFLTVCVCLSISAVYELIEWLVAVATGEAAEAFLGTQGDVWDTQTDMALAFIGALSAIVSLSKLHDRAILAMKAHSLETHSG